MFTTGWSLLSPWNVSLGLSYDANEGSGTREKSEWSPKGFGRGVQGRTITEALEGSKLTFHSRE